MHPRIAFARFLIKTGRFFQSSAVCIMRPDDLVEFSRQYYQEPDNLHDWSNDRRINSGLSNLEQSLLNRIPIRKGKLLLLGLGGGREAIALAKIGFEVTGIDFIPQMVERAKANSEKVGIEIIGLVREISKLDLPESAFDFAWLSAAMYSCVPTRKRRVDMLKRIGKTLKPGSYFVFGFLWHPGMKVSPTSNFLKKMIAYVTLGNIRYEKGDILRFNHEFFHAFTTIEELQAEIIEAGFEIIDIQLNDEYEFAGAITKKPL